MQRTLKHTSYQNATSALSILVSLLGIPVNEETLTETLHQHPNYPSLLSISDTLNEWYVNTLSIKANVDALSQIPLPAIAHIETEQEEKFVVLNEIEDNRLTYIDPENGWITEHTSSFTEKWDGVLLLVESNSQSGEPEYKKNRQLSLLERLRLPFMLGLGILFLVISFGSIFLNTQSTPNIFWMLLVAKLIGFTLSIILLTKQLRLGGKFGDIGCKFGEKMDCDSVIFSKGAYVFGNISMSELGLLYFSCGILYLILTALTGPQNIVLAFLCFTTLLAVPYTLYAICYQAFMLKKWCILCLGVHITIYLELALLVLSDFSGMILWYHHIWLIVWSLVIPVFIWLNIKKALNVTQELGFSDIYLKLLFRKPKIIQTIIDDLEYYPIKPFPFELMMGNPNADFIIVAVANPFCKSCDAMYYKLRTLLKEFDGKICCYFRIAISSEQHNSTYSFYRHLLSLYSLNWQEALQAWYESDSPKILQEWQNTFPTALGFENNEVVSTIEANIQWCQQMNIHSGPLLFINGKQLPQHIKIEHLKYYLRVENL